MTSTGIASRLAEIAGAANVSSDPSQVAPYQIDGKTPAAVARPGSSEEVAEIVKFAAAERLAIIPAGARTKLGIGMPPRQYDLALDMTRLDRVLAYDSGDLTLSVESGITLRKLAGVLSEHGQFIPLAVPFMDQATVGGTIASGVDSPLRQLYGTARDYLLGIEFVTSDGVAKKSGGRVVKNVAGYDIHKLMVGALGTLGVITKINLRTFPMPRMTRTYVARFRWANGACEFRHAIARSHLRPQSIEIIAARDSSLLRLDDRPGSLFENGRWSVLVSAAGEVEVLNRYRRELETLARGADQNALESFTELGDADESRLTSYVREFPALAAKASQPAAILKISALPKSFAGLAEGIHSVAMRHDIPWAVMMRGVGVTYLALTAQDQSAESLRHLKDACASALRCCVEGMWGRGVMPWCPAEFKREMNVWGETSGDFALMQKLKNVFDPHGTFAPGRFVGDL
ncbi:MAG TPA: FAD-binding oxidoreductase [Candidatus Acidoferrales bacterium]|nr:FAD-binding oxidoreductase [Candidatus Acidoferrales bacterium]